MPGAIARLRRSPPEPLDDFLRRRSLLATRREGALQGRRCVVPVAVPVCAPRRVTQNQRHPRWLLLARSRLLGRCWREVRDASSKIRLRDGDLGEQMPRQRQRGRMRPAAL